MMIRLLLNDAQRSMQPSGRLVGYFTAEYWMSDLEQIVR